MISHNKLMCPEINNKINNESKSSLYIHCNPLYPLQKGHRMALGMVWYCIHFAKQNHISFAIQSCFLFIWFSGLPRSTMPINTDQYQSKLHYSVITIPINSPQYLRRNYEGHCQRTFGYFRHQANIMHAIYNTTSMNSVHEIIKSYVQVGGDFEEIAKILLTGCNLTLVLQTYPRFHDRL